MHFSDRLAEVIQAKNSCLMLGLDPHWEKLPKLFKEDGSLSGKARAYQNFCQQRLDQCAEYICGVKIQMAYFEALGSVGVKAVENLIAYTRQNYPELIIMMDAKRGDIGSTSEAYAEAFLGKNSPLSGDAVTVAPYMGTDSLVPFALIAEELGKGVFVLTKTSNKSSAEIQDLKFSSKTTVAQLWAELFEGLNKKRGNPNQKYGVYGAVVGATHSEDLPQFRNILKSCWILAPGVGAQGGKIEDVLKIRDEDGLGVLIPVSRAVLYADDPRAAIKELWEAQKR